MSEVVVFHLKRFWEGHDLWEDIKTGKKTSEWRKTSSYWLNRLFRTDNQALLNTNYILVPKVQKAWFVIGYPKGNLPRLEADIIEVFYRVNTGQFEIQFRNVKEVTE